jgi:PTS system mannose-specific IIB component
VSFQVLRLQAAAEALRPGGKGPQALRTLVLLRDVRDAMALHELGVLLPLLNLGNVHFGAGRRQVAPSVFLDAGEVEALSALERQGTQVELRAVPADRPMPLSEVKARFASA